MGFFVLFLQQSFHSAVTLQNATAFLLLLKGACRLAESVEFFWLLLRQAFSVLLLRVSDPPLYTTHF